MGNRARITVVKTRMTYSSYCIKYRAAGFKPETLAISTVVHKIAHRVIRELSGRMLIVSVQ